MIHDYVADQVETCRDDVIALGQKEAEANNLWGKEKKECNIEASDLRRQLFQKTESSAMYLYLNAISLTNQESPNPNAYRSLWQESRKTYSHDSELQAWQLKTILEILWKEPPALDIDILPPGSFSIRFGFTLSEPHISRDDNDFSIIENPIRRDKVFRVPYIAPSSWKGNLRSALHHLEEKRDDPAIIRLFGNEKKKDEAGKEFHRGCLNFFPTFFYEAGLEIINPQSRQRKAGTDPILFETVPRDSSGTFCLLHVPFHRSGCPETAGEQKRLQDEVAEDLILVTEGIQAMFRTYGFSAKRTSGFGLAKETGLSGKIVVRFEDRDVNSQEEKQIFSSVNVGLPHYLESPDSLKPEYLNPDGSFHYRDKEEFMRTIKKGKKKLDKKAWQLYEKAHKWWKHQEKIGTEKEQVAEKQEAEQPTIAAKRWINRPFASFNELVEKAKSIAAIIRGGA